MYEMYGCIYYVLVNLVDVYVVLNVVVVDVFYCFIEIFGEFCDVFVMEFDATD